MVLFRRDRRRRQSKDSTLKTRRRTSSATNGENLRGSSSSPFPRQSTPIQNAATNNKAKSPNRHQGIPNEIMVERPPEGSSSNTVPLPAPTAETRIEPLRSSTRKRGGEKVERSSSKKVNEDGTALLMVLGLVVVVIGLFGFFKGLWILVLLYGWNYALMLTVLVMMCPCVAPYWALWVLIMVAVTLVPWLLSRFFVSSGEQV